MITDSQIEIKKVTVKNNAYFETEVPGSKSITNRALLIAALSDGKTVIEGALFSDDSRHFLKCLMDLGFEVEIDEEAKRVVVTGCGGTIPKKEASIYVGSAGTAARFLTAMLSMGGKYHIDASPQMRKRPMAPLLKSLEELGAVITYHENEGYFPFTIENNTNNINTGHGADTDKISVNIDNSSQFLSALLISSTLMNKDMDIEVLGKHGMAYIDITVNMMKQFGVVVEKEDNIYHIKSGKTYKAQRYFVEPDVSAACYFYAMVPLLNVKAMVKGVKRDSMQGDIKFIETLENAGCMAHEAEDGSIVLEPSKTGEYSFGHVDMSEFSDQTMTLAAIAPFAKKTTTITGIGHIKYQESDRMSAIVTELGKMGVACTMDEDSITIVPSGIKPSVVNTYEDHRMAMAFSLTGLKNGGIVIDNPSCCRKTFENYFETLFEVIEILSE